MANIYPSKSRALPYIQSNAILAALRTHPRDDEPLCQRSRRNSRLRRARRNATRIKRRTIIIFELVAHIRKDSRRRNRRRADEVRALNRAAALAGRECEAGAEGRGGEGGAGAADVPGAGADEAAVGGAAAGGGDLEGAFARERGAWRGGGACAG